MSTPSKSEHLRQTTDALITQCKAANTVAEVIGLGRSKVHGAGLDGVLHALSVEANAESIDALQAYSERLAAWVAEIRLKSRLDEPQGERKKAA